MLVDARDVGLNLIIEQSYYSGPRITKGVGWLFTLLVLIFVHRWCHHCEVNLVEKNVGARYMPLALYY